ncbi:unnamed protein product [Prorocentrum cordatum]|uniref:Uncharacterized protein n=1 Tax=Prorocentrum cordatum TaxID=2364126 RepID=A0ABN9V859_9DINO|nr:unnamed protein product [Polarella glacialis]
MVLRWSQQMVLSKRCRLRHGWFAGCSCVAFVVALSWPLCSKTDGSVSAWTSPPRRRDQFLTIGLWTVGQAVVGTPSSASGEVVPLLDKSLRRHAKQLQRAADVLVFDVRPMIYAGNWTKLAEVLKFDAFPNEAWHSAAYVVQGNEDFLPGAEDAPQVLDRTFRDLRSIIAKDLDDGRKREQALQAWWVATATVNSVMSAANNLIASEPTLNDIPNFAVVPEDVSQYLRKPEQYSRKCTVLDGLPSLLKWCQ